MNNDIFCHSATCPFVQGLELSTYKAANSIKRKIENTTVKMIDGTRLKNEKSDSGLEITIPG